MEISKITPRERLQYAYELAFFPPRIHQLWNEVKKGTIKKDEVLERLKMGLSLHLALPEKGFQSKRALKKIAICQASSKSYGTESFMKNIATYLEIDVNINYSKIPAGMIRDFSLPQFCHK